MSDIQTVKARADIVDVIGRFVHLQRSGRTFKAPCPFHQEKTPSFVVNPDRQTWHCFGACSTGGDVFQFLMRKENLTFGEALRQLAGEVGIELSGAAEGPREDYSRLIEANEAAAQYFHNLLLNADPAEAARAYVQKRGVDAPTLAAFQLGYALNSYEALRGHLTGRGFSIEELVAAGLLSEGEHQPYDRFRDRLIFPIRDDRGRVIGFGGRVLGDALPKYLNSPQTSLFDKSGTLYALDVAKDAIRAAGSAVVVEGYMDVIAAHQFGIRNVVATLGTALTERHVQILKRYTKRVTLAMDADAAGIEAAMRGDEVVRRVGASDPDAPVETMVDWTGMVRLHAVSPVEVHVFTVPQGKDPDEAIRADPAAFTKLAERAVPPFEFRLRHELAKADRTNPRAMLELADRLLPVIAGVSDRVLQAHYLSQLATATGAREEDLRGRLRGTSGASTGGARLSATPVLPVVLRERAASSRPPAVEADEDGDGRSALTPATGPVTTTSKRERFCLHLLYTFAGLRTDGMLIEEDLFDDAANRYLFQVWRGVPDVTQVAEMIEPAMASQLMSILTDRVQPLEDDAKRTRALAEVVGRMRLQRMDERKRLQMTALHEAEGAANRAAAAALARSPLEEDPSAADEGTEAEVARQAHQDMESGVRLHMLEAALRRQSAPAAQPPAAHDPRPIER